MKQLISGVSVVIANSRSGNSFVNPFRYFPRFNCFAGSIYPVPPWHIVLDWHRLDGTHLRYYYASQDINSVAFTLNAILLNAPVPPLAGGYLFNFGVRPQLTDVQIL